MTKTTATRVLIIDDHPLLRQGVTALINGQKDFTVCGEIDDPRQTITAVQKTHPDVVVLDLSLHGTSGIDVLKNLKAQFPKIKVLILSMHDETVYAPRALKAGALGYIMKEEASEKVIDGLRRILTDQVYLSPRMGAKLLHNFAGKRDGLGSPAELLSRRELEVFKLLGQGTGTCDIAEKLMLSVKTVESHRAHIKEKLNLESGMQLVHHAIQWANSECTGTKAVTTEALTTKAGAMQ